MIKSQLVFEKEILPVALKDCKSVELSLRYVLVRFKSGT